MDTLPYTRVREPFGKINYWVLPDGSIEIRAYVLGEQIRENAQTGVALQASNSMKHEYGYVGWRRFLNQRTGLNTISLQAQRMCSYLARKVDVDTHTMVTYWGAGPDGTQVQEIGHLSAFEAERHDYPGPAQFGPSAQLLPAIQYYVDLYSDANWGMYVFITDGNFQDVHAVQTYSKSLASKIAAKERNDLKLVLVGVGQDINLDRLRALDDLDTGTGLDLWDHRLAVEMKSVLDIFAEVVDENRTIASEGVIKDSSGSIVKDYRESGVPSLLTFTLPAGATAFTLETPAGITLQPVP